MFRCRFVCWHIGIGKLERKVNRVCVHLAGEDDGGGDDGGGTIERQSVSHSLRFFGKDV